MTEHAYNYPILQALPVVDPSATRLLPADAPGIAVACAGDVISVICPKEPTPEEYRTLERLAGMLVTVSVAPHDMWEELRARTGVIAPAHFDLTPVLSRALELSASDVHIAAGSPAQLRRGGILEPVEGTVALSAADCEAAARWIAGDRLDTFTGDLDLGFSYGGSRWRAAVWQQRGSYAITLRVVPVDVPRLESLSLPPSVVEISKLTQGLVLFCGPTGAGKSTSMAALVDRINRTRSAHVITIEDPIEYSHASIRSSVHQREVGQDTKDFATGLRAALRQDPDVILVGELRDQETMRTALQAAETGHLVLATVHASSAAGALTRIVNSFGAEQQTQVRLQLAASLQAVVAQLLLPDRRKERARVPACEVLLASPAVRTLLRENRLHEITSVLDTQVGAGMTSMDRSLARLAASGFVEESIARANASDANAFGEHLSHEKSSPGADFDDELDGLR
jgi:twitching motility protein PilT